MRHSYGCITTTLLLLFFVSACDDPLPTPSVVAPSTVGVVDEEESVAAEVDSPEREEGPAGPIVVVWNDLSSTGGNNIATLSLNVRNISSFTVDVSATLICDAFLDLSASRSMAPATQEITAGDEAEFSIPVDELPIQILSGAGSFRAHVQVSYTDPSDAEKTVVRIVPAPQFFFKHDSDYETMDVFSVNELVKNHDGMVVDQSLSADSVVGRVLGSGDAVTPLLAQDANITAVGEDNKEYGTVRGFHIEIEAE